MYGQINPTFQVNLPIAPSEDLPPGLQPGVTFASPPLPNEAALRKCAADAGGEESKFLSCVAEKAMPKEYRMTSECLSQNENDPARAFACSTGNKDVQVAYDKLSKAKNCWDKRRSDNDSEDMADDDKWKFTGCLADAALSENDAYYVNCITKNKGEPIKSAICGLAKNVNAEGQIALACAIKSGGEPSLFVGCTGGELFDREIKKCLRHGIATNNGCFGPNNAYRVLLRGLNGEAKRIFGENSAAYQAWNAWEKNVLAPGQNHVVIHHFNNALKDVTEGPGPDNALVVTGNKIGEVFQSIGKIKVKIF
uniref:Uncharacterized protein n=1 Tax=Bosea sp. NBC_00436 TaxID=2969620 RepID=A0A9E7ZRT0_9HYPH